MHFGRLFTFALTVVGGGLLQLWILFIILQMTGAEAKVQDILGDGGLFFFASSLAVGSAITLFDRVPLKVGNVDCNLSLLVCAGVLVITAVYCSVIAKVGASASKPFSNHVPLQIACAVASVAYWYYTGVRIGLFTKKSHEHH